jgi:hypothetical protein
MTGLTDTEAAILAARHVSAFNDAVAACNYLQFLSLFTDDAVIRFENVPGAGELEYAGREACAKAYKDQPPDDQIDICGSAKPDGNGLVVPFAWRRDGKQGTLRLAYAKNDAGSLDKRLVARMSVIFD